MRVSQVTFACRASNSSLDSAAEFECRTEQIINAGDRRLFIGRVIRATYRQGDPLVFHAGAYHAVAPLVNVTAPADAA